MLSEKLETVPEPRRIFQNTMRLTLASILRKTITLVYFVIIARYAGLNVMGLFYLVICYGSLFYAVVDLGLTNTFIRDASREPDKLEALLSRTLSLKIVLALLGTLGTLVLLQFLQYPDITNHLIYIVLSTVVLKSFASTFFAVFRVLHDMRHEATVMVVGNLATLALGAIAVALGLSPYFLIIAVALDGLVSFCMGLALVRRKLKLAISISLRPALSLEVVAVAIPFTLSALFVEVYSFDAVVLQKVMGETFVALYSVAARPISSLRFLPAMFAVVLFPLFSSRYRQHRDTLSLTFLRSQFVMLSIAAPLVVAGVAGAPAIIEFIFGPQYERSVAPFQVMALSLVPVFLTYPVLALLNACNAQKIAAANLAGAIVVHVTMSIWLIPRVGVMGAALASTLSATVLAVSCWYWAHKVSPFDLRRFGAQALKVGLATVPMLVTLAALRDRAPFLVAILLSGAAYAVAVYVAEGIDGGRFRHAAARQRFRTLAAMLLGTREGSSPSAPESPPGSARQESTFRRHGVEDRDLRPSGRHDSLSPGAQ